MTNHRDDIAEAMKVLLGIFDPTIPTDKQAVLEMKLAKKIIDRHADTHWLASYGHNLNEGFSFSYWEGRYEELAERDREDREAEARRAAKEAA
jgi:hypothetical protein